MVCSTEASGQNIYKQLNTEKCDSLILANSENPNFVILDVRTDGEWRTEHLEGSINRSTGDTDFQHKLSLLPRHKIYLLHCKAGSRSAGAFKKMKELDFEEVYEMIGGIVSWKGKNLPTTQKTEPKLMLVSHEGMHGNTTDTVKVTITNRANSQLLFTHFTIHDDHSVSHNFDQDVVLEGAEDYTFSIFHHSDYSNHDSTQIILKSNGGDLQFKVHVDNGISTAIKKIANNEKMEIYPNPARNKLFISGIDANKTVQVAMYNLAGIMVLWENSYSNQSEISLIGLSEGIHILQIKDGDTFHSKKLLINR